MGVDLCGSTPTRLQRASPPRFRHPPRGVSSVPFIMRVMQESCTIYSGKKFQEKFLYIFTVKNSSTMLKFQRFQRFTSFSNYSQNQDLRKSYYYLYIWLHKVAGVVGVKYFCLTASNINTAFLHPSSIFPIAQSQNS